MATLYRKTATGLAEVQARAHRLTPRLRGALILVDGRRSEEELLRMLAVDGAATLGGLVAMGLIESFDGPAAALVPTMAPAPPPARRLVPYEELRREAVRRLHDQVGPGAASLAERMAQAPDLETLRPLLVLARRLITELRGAQAGEDYIEGLSAM